MGIAFRCASCKSQITVPPEYIGKRVRCRKCAAEQVVPDTKRQSTAASPADAGAKDAAAAGSPKPDPAPATPPRYEAFISYRHTPEDRAWAQWLHSNLERYRTPRRLTRERSVPARLLPVFRDEEELPASSNLSINIRDALDGSRFLIVVCSRSTPASEWVNREIERFRELGRHDRILALLVDGEPGEAFPQALREIRRSVVTAGKKGERIEEVEPLAADVRQRFGESERHLRRMAKLRLLACILGVSFDDLRRREAERGRQRALIASGVAAALLLIIGILGGIALQARRAAHAEQLIAQEQTDLAAEKARFGDEEKALANRKTAEAAASAREAAKNKADANANQLKADENARIAAKNKQEADEKAREAIEKGKEAVEQKKLRRWPQYLADMQQIPALWAAGESLKVRELLQRQVPDPQAHEEDLRGIEWYYWNRQSSPGQQLETGIRRIRSMAISEDGKRLAATGEGTVVVFDTASGKKLWTASLGRMAWVVNAPEWDQSVAISPDGARVAAVCLISTDKRNRNSGLASLGVWDAATGKEIFTSAGEKSICGYSVAFSPDGAQVLAGGYENQYGSWDASTAKPLVRAQMTVQPRPGTFTTAIHMVPMVSMVFTGGRLVCGTLKDRSSIYKWPGGELERNPSYAYQNPTNVSLIGGSSKPIFFNVTNGQLDISFYPADAQASGKQLEVRHLGAPSEMTCCACRGSVVAAGCADNIVRVWDVGWSANSVGAVKEYRGAVGITTVALGHGLLAMGGGDGNIRLLNTADRGEQIDLPTVPASHAVIDEQHFYTADDSLKGVKQGRLFIVTRSADQAVVLQFAAAGPLINAVFSPHNKYVAVLFNERGAGRGKNAEKSPYIQVWDIAAGNLTATVTLRKNWVNREMAFSPDDSLIALPMFQIAKVFRCADGTEVASFDSKFAVVAAFSPSSRYVAIGGDQFDVFELATSKSIYHTVRRSMQFVFDPSDKRVILMGLGSDPTLVVNLETGATEPSAFGQGGAGQKMAFSTDGRRAYLVNQKTVAVYSSDGSAHLADIACEHTPDIDRVPDGMLALLDQWKREAD